MHTKLVGLYKINDFMIWDDFTTEKYDVEWSYIKGSVDKNEEEITVLVNEAMCW